jgi:hypothetical protein
MTLLSLGSLAATALVTDGCSPIQLDFVPEGDAESGEGSTGDDGGTDVDADADEDADADADADAESGFFDYSDGDSAFFDYGDGDSGFFYDADDGSGFGDGAHSD